jgi:molybdate transport system substrate-binding protein
MKRRGLIGLALAGAAVGGGALRAQDRAIVVFAAASLKNALDEIAAAWSRDTGKAVPRISYAASSALARQIEQGAPADLFLSADLDWMDYVEKKGLLRQDTRFNLLGNRIVLIAPRGSGTALELKPGIDLAKALAGGKLAMANVDAVPAGKYGKAALEKLGAWDGVKGSIAQADNVRAALLLVSRGEAPLGVVYATDAAAEPNVRIVAAFPEGSYPPVIYPAAQTKDSTSPDARAFLDHLRGAKARPVFESQGFTVLARSGSST